eukprot:Em0014g821a
MSRFVFFLVILSHGVWARRIHKSEILFQERIKNYEVFTPVITYGDQKQTNLDVSIVTKTYNFIIRLTKNEQLLSSNFVSTHFDSQGNEVTTEGLPNCFYYGEVVGHPSWTATISTCSGIRGSFGDMAKGSNSFYYIEPLGENKKMRSFLGQPHVLFQDNGVPGRSENSRKNTLIPNKVDQELYNWRQRVGSQSAPLIIRLVIINDLAMYKKYGKDLAKTLNRAIDIVNAVDSMYKILGIRIVLVEAITWSDGDRITVVESDMEKTYRKFKDYVKTASTAEKDAILLLSGVVYTDDNNGMGRLNSVCDPFSLAVVRDRDILYQTSSTTAHELGHTLGLDHDNDIKGCFCPDDQGCIMTTYSSRRAIKTLWSSCSYDEFDKLLSERKTLSCLKSDVPKTINAHAICGNGILEGSEKCDCGSVAECTDPCCDARKCQLKSGANC